MQRPGLFALILLVLGLAGLLSAAGGRWEPYSHHWYTNSSLPPAGRGEPDKIRRTVYADGRIWVLAGGEIWSVGDAGATARRTGVAAYDICAHQGALVAVTPEPRSPEGWRVTKQTSGGWTILARPRHHGAGLVALECSADVRLLTSDRLMTVGNPGSTTTILLSERIPAWPPTAILATAHHLLVGVNAGEWGGGIWRIDEGSGVVERLGRPGGGDVCVPPLEIACTPVNDLTAHPWRPDCSLAAVGSIQDTNGGLLEVCGAQVRALTPAVDPSAPRAGNSAYFGLVATKHDVKASTVAGVRTLHANGALEAPDRPHFKTDGPFHISLQPGFALIRAASDERFHPGGSNAFVVQLAAR